MTDELNSNQRIICTSCIYEKPYCHCSYGAWATIPKSIHQRDRRNWLLQEKVVYVTK